MTEEHKQKIRDGLARKRAEQGKAPDTDPTPELATGPDPDTFTVNSGAPSSGGCVEPSPGTAHPEPPSVPDDLFYQWLRTPGGLYCNDPRVPQDRVRFAIHLEDVLKKAFIAGYRENEI